VAKQIEVRCSSEVATLIIAALEWFVARTYPRASDECSAAAREALLDLADRFKRELLMEGRALYSSRIRAFLCEAVKGYLAEQEALSGRSYTHRCRVLIDVCRGDSDDAGFAEADRLDG